jgi:hypothetical protein
VTYIKIWTNLLFLEREREREREKGINMKTLNKKPSHPERLSVS